MAGMKVLAIFFRFGEILIRRPYFVLRCEASD